MAIPAKAVFAERSTPSSEGDVHLTPSQQYGVLPQQEYMQRTGNKVVLNLSGADNMRHVEPGDFISHLRSFQGGLEYSRIAGKVSAAYTVLSPRLELAGDYFRYLFKSRMYIQGVQTTTDQLRDGQSIRFAQFARLGLPLPALEEQRQIAAYLDRETGKIDTLIEKQVQLINKLIERRDSVISRVITKGLSADVKLKDSGITWLGRQTGCLGHLRGTRSRRGGRR
jgi:type I restriction enzyme S subunit